MLRTAAVQDYGGGSVADAFKKVQAGQPLVVPAQAYNAFVDAAKDFQQRTRHVGQAKDATGLLDLSAWQKRVDPAQWKESLSRPQDEPLVKRLRLSTSRGRPLGSDAFVAKLETLLGRRLRPLPRGRPKKNARKENK